MSSQQLDEERIFHLARRQPDTAAREEYLDQICAGDQALRERVEALLEAHEKEQSFLKSNDSLEPTVDHSPLVERQGTSIGRYKLMEQIGEGGMGTVFVAQQDRPIRRKVALKVIKPGMDSKAVVARFEAERQALAMMDHPNIAKVLDAGTTDAGRPYFVMELVKGMPITEYCDRNRMTIRERLELFTQFCQAIQHAHQKRNCSASSWADLHVLTDDQRADDAFARLAAEDWWGACRAAYLFRTGKIDTATAITPNDVELRPFAAIVKYTISAARGKSEDAMKGYKKIKAAHSSSYVRAFAMQIPAVAGELTTASEDARQWLRDGDVPDFPFFFARTKLTYFADPSTQSAMLQTVDKYRMGSCYAHYAIAVSHFRTNPQLAGDHFRECLKTNLFWCPEYCMAKAFLAQCPELHRRNTDQAGRTNDKPAIR